MQSNNRALHPLKEYGRKRLVIVVAVLIAVVGAVLYGYEPGTAAAAVTAVALALTAVLDLSDRVLGGRSALRPAPGTEQ
ncbi:hypothetical protein ACH419_41565 [Streptomyces bobili]|uniref:hypothetical protein n=1 Tax=Streptomyces bobili TaxID=67280 RepID=UPI0037A265A2